ncbi:DEAD/DEAH box helicase family protein [Pseudomonas protegens]|uniref:DEAD/DEAH box helicase n=2 Tax=Pseudomonas chlororaphis group TaxID=136842 RepID=UPI0023EB243B|nr:DEAD/DEAH box helicase family protein [Pseudomonas protegens]MDF4205068.1 DEAD/DEAH box helicase family protein [Pseudomonas protegens]
MSYHESNENIVRNYHHKGTYMNYYQHTVANIEGNSKLRSPQIEAYLQIKKYFSDNPNGEALVVLPTGTGKSGLISIAPYGVANGRVLIITPGLVTKNSIRKTQEALEDNFWVNCNVLLDPDDLPAITEYDSSTLIANLDTCNMVYTNIHQVYSTRGNSLVDRVPKNYFDLIIVDEAHHAPAESWTKTLSYFSAAKKLFLTGTPFRGDNQELPGELIHETQLSEVMRDRYVKWLRKETVNAHNLSFTLAAYPGRSFSKEEVLQLKDREWLEKSVALSEACSKDVIQHSYSKLRELKSESPSVPHKILAVGCSIRHANDLHSWYEELGTTVVTIHSEMSEEDQEQAFRKIENHECEVVVSVNMLMEGYDHRYLTVLALFRPYRSLNAFAQIVGRVLRAIPEDEIKAFEIDNNALIVFHQETGLDVMWQAFQTEVDRAKHQRTREYEFSEYEYTERDNALAGISTEDVFAGQTDSYLDDIDFNELFEKKRLEISQSADKQLETLQTSGPALDLSTIEKLRSVLIDAELKKASSEINPNLIAKRPELARKDLRALLVKKSQDAAASLISDKGLEDKGIELFPRFARHLKYMKKDTPNDGVLVMYINAKIHSRYGARDQMDNRQLLNAVDMMPHIVNELRGMLK